ncbi:MAG TPA: extracellular solute-binding protein [Stellaceae bacterium]|jgi:iron(III) transport system substrate-binding protein|nr:extracellular solute-binding protein [Stellaceae bacterium]
MRKLAAGLAVAMLACAGPALADDGDLCAKPTETHGFKTCADLAKAEAEGEIVVYATNPEAAESKVLASFRALFPKIKTSYVRLQAGALYAKVLAERQAKVYAVDILQLSDMGMVLDFQKKGGYVRYVSPEMAAYKPDYKSHPEGLWTWGALGPAGIAYNPDVVSAAEAPKTWQEAIDPKWTDGISVKVSNSGLQHVGWYELRRLYGPDYWKKFAALKPRAFDSYVQQYDRLVNHQDKIIHTAQYSGYLEWKAKGAPVAFVAPPDGLPATPESWGLVAGGPHPNAARLYLDWFLSNEGQTVNGRFLYLHSARAGAPPPPGGEATDEMKLLMPDDWNKFLASRVEFQREWDKATGLR